MTDDEIWKKRFRLFLAARLFGLATFLLGLAIALSDLVRPGGWKLLGGLVVIVGVIDAVFAPRVLKKAWQQQDALQKPKSKPHVPKWPL